MSLNGLDDPPIIEAYQTALAEAGGWFLLKYTSRDVVDLLARGTGGVAEIRVTIDSYEEKSPLYGFLQYRRRKIILRYIPEGISRLIQARITVQFQSILDKFSPHDTVFSLSISSELTENALSSACQLHTASNSMTSSTSSLRRRRLGEITEDAEESGPPTLSPAERYERRESVFSGISEATAVPAQHQSRDIVTSSKADSSPQFSGNPFESKPNKPLPSAPRDYTGARTNGVAQKHLLDHLSHPIPDSRKSSQSTRPTLRDLDQISLHKPKVRLGPRPSAKVTDRPRTAGSMSGPSETRPVASLPAGVRSSSSRKAPTYRPRSQPGVVSPQLSPSEIPPVPPLLVPPPPILLGSFSRNAPGSPRSIRSVPATIGVTPERQRLMRALELRKKQLAKKSENKPESKPESKQESKPEQPKPEEIIPAPETRKINNEVSSLDAAIQREEVVTHTEQKQSPTKPQTENSSENIPTTPRLSSETSPEKPPSPDLSAPDSAVHLVLNTHENVKEDPKAIETAPNTPNTTHDVGSSSSSRTSTEVQEVIETKTKDGPKVEASVEESTENITIKDDPEYNTTPAEKRIDDKEQDVHALETEEGKLEEPEVGRLDVKQKENLDSPETSRQSIDESAANEQNAPELKTPQDNPIDPIQIPIPSDDSDHWADTPTPRAIPPEILQESENVGEIEEPGSKSPDAVAQNTTEEPGSNPLDESTPETLASKPSEELIEPVSQVNAADRPLSESLSVIHHGERSSANFEAKDEMSLAKRRGVLEPIHISTKAEESDEDNLLSDDSFMEELGSATVEEAKPIAVPKTPRNNGDNSPGGRWKGSRFVSNQSVSGSDVQALPTGRSASGGYFDNHEAVPVLVAKKVNVSSGISKRIKALEMFSSREPSASPTTTLRPSRANSNASTSPFDMFRKRASLTSSIVSLTPSTESPPPPIPPRRHETISTTTRNKSNSVSVTARINRDASNPPVENPADNSEPSAINLQRSEIIVEHDADQARSQILTLATKQDKRMSTSSSTKSNRHSIAGPVPHSDSISSRLSISSRSKFDNPFSRSSSDLSPSPLNSVDGGKEEKKESRKSRIMRRMSSITSSPRRGLKHAISPSLREEEAPAVETPPAEVEPTPEPSQAIDIGEVNVQFPDTLLWKRRFMRVDGQGYLVLTPGNIDGSARNIVKKYHLSEFRAPSLPDQDRQELPNSIVLDFQDGNTLQCACESRQSQNSVLQVLLDAHRAYQAVSMH